MRGSIDPGEKNNIIVVYDDILFSAPPGPDGAARPLLLSVMMESGWRDAKRVYRPEDPEEDMSRKPCILWFPGGGWTHVERNFMNGEMAFLARAGYVVVSVSYRTSAQAHLPGQLEDAASALRFLGEHAGEYRIDRSRIGVMGRSAGAYFAVWLGLNEMLPGTGEMPGRDGLPAVRACCDLFGPVDLERLIDYELSPNAFPKSRVSRPKDSHAGKLLGLNGSEPPEEIRRMAREMSPLHHITDRMCPPADFARGQRPGGACGNFRGPAVRCGPGGRAGEPGGISDGPSRGPRIPGILSGRNERTDSGFLRADTGL